MADNYPQSPDVSMAATIANTGTLEKTPNIEPIAKIGKFPLASDLNRLNDYEYYKKLFMGKHFEAFNVRIGDKDYNRAHAKLRFLVVNFAGLLSKIMADMLFGEPVSVKLPNGDQEWLDAFWRENNMDVQCYESALGNSYNGDAIFKLRIGPRNEKSESTVIVEDIVPKIYFPKIDGFNVRATSKEQVLAWTFVLDGETYLRQEIHTPGKIQNKVFKMKGEDIVAPVSVSTLGDGSIKEEEDTGINESLIVHIPNWKTGDRHFGLSDYLDLDTLFYALCNRLSKIDNILDTHGDPILMVPPGIIDEHGNVNKKALGVVEVKEGENNKPEYIVWDASLDSAFKEVEKLVEMLYLTAEISPDVLGMGTGTSDSGRALKFKLMRTLAKVSRKRLYYDHAIKQLVYTAQKFAKANNIAINGKQLSGEPVMPEIDWKDGLPIDNHEQLLDEIQAVDAGLTPKTEAIMRLYDVDEKSAEEQLKVIEKERPAITVPSMDASKSNPFMQKKDDKTQPTTK